MQLRLPDLTSDMQTAYSKGKLRLMHEQAFIRLMAYHLRDNVEGDDRSKANIQRLLRKDPHCLS